MTLPGYPAQGWRSVHPAPVPVQSLSCGPLSLKHSSNPLPVVASGMLDAFQRRLILGGRTGVKHGIEATRLT